MKEPAWHDGFRNLVRSQVPIYWHEPAPSDHDSIFLEPDIFLQGFYDKEIDKTDLGGGIGVSIPFWYQNQGGIQSAKAEERKATSDLKLLEIETGNRLDDEYKNYKIAFEQSKIFSGELLNQAKRSLEIAEFSYEQGETELLDVLDALRTYRDTLKENYQVLYEFYISKITLEKIAGGKM